MMAMLGVMRLVGLIAITVAVASAQSLRFDTDADLPDARVGSPYAESISARGGERPYRFEMRSGTLPPGIFYVSLTSTLVGIPVESGTFRFTIRVSDDDDDSAQREFRIRVIGTQPPAVTTTTLPNGQVTQPYSATLAATGGNTPYTWSVSGGALPGGVSLNANGSISGIPTAAGNFDFTARVVDDSDRSATRALRITIAPAPTPPTVTTSALPNGTVGQLYNATLAASGGATPYAWSSSAGALPGGLNLNPNGSLSGTPTAAGNFDFTASVKDANNLSATRALRITIAAAPTPPSITTSTLPNGTVNQAYGATLAATGGVAPYAWSVSAGALPGGLNLNPNGSISGTPRAAGTFDFTASVKDANNLSATRALRITIAAAPTPPSITTSTLPNGTVNQAYGATLAATGGVAPYAWSVSAGALPGGLNLNPNGSLSGTPTAAGNFDFTASVTDANSLSSTRQLRITINPAATPPTITTTSLSAGTINQSYTGAIAATGGTPPYVFTAIAGNFAPGLGLSPDGSISGTPTTAGNFDFTVRVTDSANQSATRPLRFTINAAATAPAISNAALPNASVGVEYVQALQATGGRAPYVWSIASGALPAGVTLSPSGSIAGTPSAAGPATFTLRVTDADSRTAERAFTITVGAAVTISACPAQGGFLNTSYSAAATGTGGAPPYLWSVTTGQLPPGITLNAGSGLFSGTPLLGGAFNFTLNISDASARTGARTCTITIGSPIQIVTEILPDATIREAYSQTLRASGGSPPYRWVAISGALPPGISLDANAGTVSGQPVLPGRFTFNIQVSDASGATTQRAFTIAVASGLTIPGCPASIGIANQSYSSTLTVVGGQAPYNWSVSSGTLPLGLNLASATGVLAGTPAAADRAEFTLRVADATNATAERPCAIQVAPELVISTASMPQAEVGANYSTTLEAAGGTAPRNWTITAGALAPGLTLSSATGQITGAATAPGTYRFIARVIDATGAQRDKQFEIVVGSGFTISACPTPSAVFGQPYSSSVSLSGGEAPVVWAVSSGALPGGLNLSAQTGVITGTPTVLGNVDFTIGASDSQSRATTRACAINVVPAALRMIVPEPVSDAILGSAYRTSLQAEGGRGPYVWSLAEGTLPPGISLGGDGSLSGTPSATGVFPVIVRVVDADRGAATRSFTIRVIPARAPNVIFTDLPDIIQPAQQPRVRVVLDSPYPVALRGRLALRFTPDPGLSVDDPSIRFVTGDRTVDFDVPENSTEAVFPVPQLALQTGSVAGVIDLNVALRAGDLDVTPTTSAGKSIRIDRTAPVITSLRVNLMAGGFELVITGYSTTREVTSATFTFTPASGSRLESTQATVQTESAARQWFNDTASNGFGGQFTFTQPFTISNATLSEVSVTLTNSQGTSQPSRARF